MTGNETLWVQAELARDADELYEQHTKTAIAAMKAGGLSESQIKEALGSIYMHAFREGRDAAAKWESNVAELVRSISEVPCF